MIGVAGLEGRLGHSDIRPRIIVSFDSSFIDGALGLAFVAQGALRLHTAVARLFHFTWLEFPPVITSYDRDHVGQATVTHFHCAAVEDFT